MATYVPPKRATQFITYIGLPSQTSTASFQSNPTIAAGDFKVSIDGGALANLATLPAVTPASSKMVKITLSTSEMTGDNITVVCSDAAGAEWCDVIFNIQTAARQIDDLAFPNTSGRGIDVTAGGEVGIDWGNIGSPTTTVALSNTTVSSSQIAASVTGAVGSVTGNVTGSIGSLAAQAQTDVNDQVLSVIGSSTFAEPGQGAPAATASIATKIGYIYKFLRNKVTQSSTVFSVYDDAGTTVDQKATVSDDGTTFTRSEIESGP